MGHVFRPKSGDARYTLSEQEAFLALTLFVNQFYARAGDDLPTLMADISIEEDGGTLDPAAWADWLECVRATGEDPNAQPDTWKALGLPTVVR